MKEGYLTICEYYLGSLHELQQKTLIPERYSLQDYF